MGLGIGIFGMLFSFVSVLAIIIFGILYFFNKIKGNNVTKLKKSFFISIGALIVSIVIIILGVNINYNQDTSTDSIASNDQSQLDKDNVVENSNVDKDISKKQYNEIKIGMNKSDVEKRLGKVSEENTIDITNRYEWTYSGKGSGLAYISFSKKNNKVIEKSELGILSETSSTITNKKGTRKDDLLEEDEQDGIESVKSNTKDFISSFIDENFKSGTELKKFELNENIGTEKDNDYIALVYMKMDKVYSAKSGFNWIEKYTNYLAAELASNDNNISELVIFWSMPQFADKNYNVAKYNLKRNNNQFYFEKKWQDNRLIN